MLDAFHKRKSCLTKRMENHYENSKNAWYNREFGELKPIKPNKTVSEKRKEGFLLRKETECGILAYNEVCEIAEDYITTLIDDINDEFSRADPETEGFYRLQELRFALTQIENEKDKINKEIKERMEATPDKDKQAVATELIQGVINRLYDASPSCTEFSPAKLDDIKTHRTNSLSLPNSLLTACCFMNGTDPHNLLEGTTVHGFSKPVQDVYCYQVIGTERVPASLTLFDLIVLSGVCSIATEYYRNNQPNFVMSIPMIYEAVTGKPYQSKTNYIPKIITDISKSIDKMRSTFIEFNWRDQAEDMLKHNKFKGDKKPIPEKCIVVNSNILNMVCVTAKLNGEIVNQAYKLLEIPALYRYDKTISQIITLSKDILQAPNISITRDNVSLMVCLARRIELMKNKHNSMFSNRIANDFIFEQCQFDKFNKLERQRKKETTFKILDGWKKIHFIKDYTAIIQGRKYVGVEIVTAK